jgi:drug/metabolite transporter (DMT)-like permease
MLNKLSPFFAVIFSFFILKEKISPTQMIALMIAFIGSLFIIKPSFANTEFIPGLAGLLGGIFAGFAYTMVRKLGNRGQSGISIVFFFSAFSTAASLLVTIFVFEPMTMQQVIFMILAGLSALGGQLGITNAYIYAPAKEISIYDYSQIIFATVLGFLVFGQVPDFYSFIGYVIIISMAFTMFQYNKKRIEKKAESKQYNQSKEVRVGE